jgi:hypothetical protein
MRTREGSTSDASSPVGSRSSSSVDSPGTVNNGGEVVMSPVSPLGVNTFGSPFSFGSEVSSPHEVLLSPTSREHAPPSDGELLLGTIIKPETESLGMPCSSMALVTTPTAPRRRGRPRKDQSKDKGFAVIDEKIETKKAKGRTKTGCFTCRERKKKCDEAKPICEYSISYDSD